MAEDIPLAVRKIVYERDGGSCRWCGRHNGVAIHLHHIVYRSGGGQHVPENLISLCAADHAHAHTSKNDYQQLLLDLVQQEPNVTMFQLMRWRKRPDVQIQIDRDEATGPVGRLLAIDLIHIAPPTRPEPPSPIGDHHMTVYFDAARFTHAERLRQLEKWSEQNHPDGTSSNNQQIADAARESCELAFAEGRGSWFDILLEEVMEASAEVDENALYVELIQVAAVAESWADAIRRRQANRLAVEDNIDTPDGDLMDTLQAIEGGVA